MKNKSPHNSRIFTARLLLGTEKLAFWTFLVSLFSFNIVSLSHWHLSYSDKLFDVFARPLAWDAHMNLAQTLWETHAWEEAKEELLLAQELFPPALDVRILGVSTTPLDLLTIWTSEPKRKEQEVLFWQNVIQAHPDYRDGYIQLASLSYTDGNLAEAQNYISKAQTLDPNGEVIQKLGEFLSKK